MNIPGFGYFGREPYSPVDRIERRFQFSDNVSISHGRHTFKFGADANLIQLRSKKQQIFQLDFGGDVNFGGIALFGSSLPAMQTHLLDRLKPGLAICNVIHGAQVKVKDTLS